MKRDFYSDSITTFLETSIDEIRGVLTENNQFNLELTQKESWNKEIYILKDVLKNYNGSIFFEYAIPRMGRRIDVVLIIRNVIFILEFKVGEKEYLSSAIDQVWDYALDLKNFHKTSHEHLIAPILISTEANDIVIEISTSSHNDNVLFPIITNSKLLRNVIENVLEFSDGAYIDAKNWAEGSYSPTPTIIEAAMALYNNHSVADISRSDAAAINLTQTSDAITEVIEKAKKNNEKTICFITGVPGAGKTLVGLDIANKHLEKEKGTTSVFLSGNGPLVAILREALTRDKVKREKEIGNKIKKGEVMSRVKVFIQNVHHFRDECLIDSNSAPFDHIAIFDEAQRAWNHTQTASFMQRKKNVPNFLFSEPEFLISCLDRHDDWAVIICLVGGGQEINTGEAGISEWIEALNRSYPSWHVYISSNLTDSEYAAGEALKLLENRGNVFYKDQLHLSVSMRSFRAEYLSLLIKNILDINILEAKKNYNSVKEKYPIVLTRNLTKAKKWLKEKARGSE